MGTSDTAVYLYCVVRAPRRPSLARVPPGVAHGSPPQLHGIAPSWWVVAASVPLEVYGPTHLEPRLRDLEWVANVAVAHEAVTAHFARARANVVVPMKLFTMFSSVSSAVAGIGARRRALERSMRSIGGCEEWGVRVVRRAVPAVGGRRDGADGGAGGPPRTGAAYLAARKADRDRAASAKAEALAAADAAFARLSRHARQVRRREGAREPGTNPPILEAAFLVPVVRRARFRAEVRRQISAVDQAGADLTLTGPWPAYHFVSDGA